MGGPRFLPITIDETADATPNRNAMVKGDIFGLASMNDCLRLSAPCVKSGSGTGRLDKIHP